MAYDKKLKSTSVFSKIVTLVKCTKIKKSQRKIRKKRNLECHKDTGGYGLCLPSWILPSILNFEGHLSWHPACNKLTRENEPSPPKNM